MFPVKQADEVFAVHRLISLHGCIYFSIQVFQVAVFLIQAYIIAGAFLQFAAVLPYQLIGTIHTLVQHRNILHFFAAFKKVFAGTREAEAGYIYYLIPFFEEHSLLLILSFIIFFKFITPAIVQLKHQEALIIAQVHFTLLRRNHIIVTTALAVIIDEHI
ncbi:hypothetical protein D3C86_1580670 [compost metagenome]